MNKRKKERKKIKAIKAKKNKKGKKSLSRESHIINLRWQWYTR